MKQTTKIKLYSDSFYIFGYIRRAMKKAGVKRGEQSLDTVERVIDIAERALRNDSEELIFEKFGDSWAAAIHLK